MDGLQWKTLLKWDDLGVPLFLETSKYIPNFRRLQPFRFGLVSSRFSLRDTFVPGLPGRLLAAGVESHLGWEAWANRVTVVKPAVSSVPLIDGR